MARASSRQKLWAGAAVVAVAGGDVGSVQGAGDGDAAGEDDQPVGDADGLGGGELGQVEGEGDGERDPAAPFEDAGPPDGSGHHDGADGKGEEPDGDEHDPEPEPDRVRHRHQGRVVAVDRFLTEGVEPEGFGPVEGQRQSDPDRRDHRGAGAEPVGGRGTEPAGHAEEPEGDEHEHDHGEGVGDQPRCRGERRRPVEGLLVGEGPQGRIGDEQHAGGHERGAGGPRHLVVARGIDMVGVVVSRGAHGMPPGGSLGCDGRGVHVSAPARGQWARAVSRPVTRRAKDRSTSWGMPKLPAASRATKPCNAACTARVASIKSSPSSP